MNTHSQVGRNLLIGATIALVLGLLVVGTMVSLYPGQAQALSCMMPGTAQEELTKADQVFYGELSALDLDEGDPGIGGDERGTITFAVKEWFKGDLGDTVELELGSYTTWYGKPSVGAEAVLYLTQYEGEEPLYMPLCGRSVIGNVSTELAFLEGNDPVVEPPTSFAVECHDIYPGMSVPQGFGAPFDTRARADDMYLEASCNSTGEVTLRTANNEYTYQTGYLAVEGKWQAFAFTGNENGSWLAGPAEYAVPEGLLKPGETHYYVAFTCNYDNGWRCGCQDEACDAPAWQVQKISVPVFEDIEEPIACTMDAMQCPDGSYVGRSGPNCEFVCPAS